MKQTSAGLLIVGDTGSGKTSLIATLAEYVWLKYGKITRLATFDPGGYGDDVLAAVKHGILQVFRGYTRDPEGNLGLALETCSLVTRGYWPKEIADRETGEVRPNVEMVAPASHVYVMLCPQGHPVRKAFAAQQLVPTACPTCKVLTSQENCKEIKHESVTAPGFEKVGAFAFDGLTSMSEWGMNEMGVRASRNELGGEKSAINTLISGGMKYGSGNRAAVGFMQSRAHEWVMNALAIPGQVVPATFTSLELRATDDRTDMVIYGPKIAGQAKTAEVPSWFGNCLGAAVYPTEKGPQWRLYLREYRMPGETAPHLCKVRATPGTMPDFLADPPGGEPFTEFSLGKFYGLLEGSFKKAEERLAERLGGEKPPLPPPPPQESKKEGGAPVAAAAAAAPPAAPPARPQPAAVKSPGPPPSVVPPAAGRVPPAAGAVRPPGVALGAAATSALAPPPPPPPAPKPLAGGPVVRAPLPPAGARPAPRPPSKPPVAIPAAAAVKK